MNRAAAKRHALKCSREHRAGKFNRVSEPYLLAVEADLDTLVRQIRNFSPIPYGFQFTEPEAANFVTGYLVDKIKDELNAAVARIIQRRVHRHPSLGKTLMD